MTESNNKPPDQDPPAPATVDPVASQREPEVDSGKLADTGARSADPSDGAYKNNSSSSKIKLIPDFAGIIAFIGVIILFWQDHKTDELLRPHLEPVLHSRYTPPEGHLGFVNKGVRTAKISDVHVFVDGQPVKYEKGDANLRWRNVLAALKLQYNWQRYDDSLDRGLFLTENSSIYVLELEKAVATNESVKLFLDAKKKLDIVVCYCTITDDDCAFTSLRPIEIVAAEQSCPTESEVKAALSHH